MKDMSNTELCTHLVLRIRRVGLDAHDPDETWQVSFPSGWKDIDYWYGPNISSQLSADKRRGLSATTFEAEQTKIIYYVDFGSLTQRNVTSGRIRKIRCIPSW